MKLLLGLLLSVAISSAFALPAGSPKDDVDLVEVPRTGPPRSGGIGEIDDETDVDPDFRDFKGVVDTGAGYPFLAPLPHPFSFNLGFFDSFEDIFRRLRTRLWSVGSSESSEEGGFALGLDPKGANTTSVVKVVDGHKIEINDTVVGNGDGSNGAVFKFRVINIRPLESGEEVPEAEGGAQTPTTQQTRDIEGKSEEENKTEISEQKSNENEINANIDDPETTTTEAIATEMHDTVPHRIASYDNNSVDENDSSADRDELQEATTDTTVESFDDDDEVATLDEQDDNTSPDTIKTEQLSAAENINDDDDDDDDEKDESGAVKDEMAEDVEALEELLEERQKLKEILAGQQMQELVEAVGEKLSMADPEVERFADAVESMISEKLEGNTDEDSSSSSQQRLPNHSLREDLPSSDDEEDNEDVKDVSSSSHQGVDSEWGSLDDKNILTNEIDVYESVPIDLSNDIAINDIMADQGAPVDPDAEVFTVDEFAPSTGEFMAGRRFEVLRDIK